MAVDITAELAANDAAYTELEQKFAAAVAQFESVINDTGAGFDIDTWLTSVPTPSLSLQQIAEVVAPDLTPSIPTVPLPTLIKPETIMSLVAGGYDSAYLEEMEQQIRAITADVLDDVIPASLYDEYYKQDRANKARQTVDKVDEVLDAQAKRGFPILPMRAARLSADVVSAWQQDQFEQQDKVSWERLDLARKIHFASIAAGTDIEALRAKLIAQYASFYSDHNRTLVAYYEQLMAERLAEARLILDNIKAQFSKDKTNVELLEMENKAEVELPNEVYKRAVQRLELEFKVDEENVKRRQQAMGIIADTYAGWAVGLLGQSQSMAVGKHSVAS